MLAADRERLQQLIGQLSGKYGTDRVNLIAYLRAVQDEFGYISDAAMQEVADILGIFPIEVQEVVSFYAFLTREKLGKYVIRLSNCMPAVMAGRDIIARFLENELDIEFGETTEDGMFTLLDTACMGMCDQTPAMMINNKVFTNLTPEKVHEIITGLKRGGVTLDPDTSEIEKNLKKTGPLLEVTDEDNKALKKALDMKRVDVIGEVRESGLRGRGGAGFPTSVKWQLAAAASGDQKIVVCNADEGEPGTFKDRLLLDYYLDQLLDGMTIAGYAIGANKGYIYLRGEYTYLQNKIEKALEERRENNLLGENILGKGYKFDLFVTMGAGAYVCGEETALIESLEGKRGEPRNRPPFPVAKGFCCYPTIVNNVETFIAASQIVINGAGWFKEHGTEKSTGTKLFSISGDCETPGIYELPMGTTVKEMLKIVGGETAKAVQVGGAAGTMVPRSEFGRAMGYEDVSTGGSIMIFGPERDMLEVAENFMEFFVEESCGQCVPCRLGTAKLLEGIDMLFDGECSISYLNQLKELGATMQRASKCGLGQTAPNAFLRIVENFKDEVLGR